MAVGPIVGFIILAAALAALLDPVATAINASLDHVVPSWLSTDTDTTVVVSYGRTAVIVAMALNFLIDVIASPVRRGALLEGLPHATDPLQCRRSADCARDPVRGSTLLTAG